MQKFQDTKLWRSYSHSHRLSLLVHVCSSRTSTNTCRVDRALSPQDPAQADKLTKIQRDLDETKVILHKTIESMLERGEKLDSLVDKSSDLSMASQMFYKQARKTNSCCKMM